MNVSIADEGGLADERGGKQQISDRSQTGRTRTGRWKAGSGMSLDLVARGPGACPSADKSSGRGPRDTSSAKQDEVDCGKAGASRRRAEFPGPPAPAEQRLYGRWMRQQVSDQRAGDYAS